ncbi:hypothetical protein AALB39_04760 [Lachnospiraceae bacterium 54-53]
MIKLFLLEKRVYSFHSVVRIVHSIDPNGTVIYDKNGRAVIKQAKLHLGISHSGDWAVIGVGEEPLGVDVQKYKGKSRDFIEYITGENDMAPPQVCKIWSIKESYVKWLGTGWIGLEPDEIVIDFNTQKVYGAKKSAYFITSEIFETYAVSVCSESSSILKERIFFQ